ncbi:MAG: GH116 family glycosyl hydrolase [Pseudomonadota bacterium]
MRPKAPEWAWTVPTSWSPKYPPTKLIPEQIDFGGIAGVPFGGVGTGAFNRGPHGGIARQTLRTGYLEATYRASNGFAVWQQAEGANRPDAAALRPPPEGGPMRAWSFRPNGGIYSALFPKSWHHYPAPEGQSVDVTIEQISPIFPGAELDMSLPVGLFRATLENTGPRGADASIMLSFENLVGCASAFPGDMAANAVAGRSAALSESHGVLGVKFRRETAEDTLGETDGELMIAVSPALGFEISGVPAFSPRWDAERLWRQFREDGTVWLDRESWVTGGGFSEHEAPEQCGAIAAKCHLDQGQSRTIEFAIVWDFPVVAFGQGRRRFRRYTELFGTEGRSSADIARRVFAKSSMWSAAIDAEHETLARRSTFDPASTAFIANSLGPLMEGYTVWTASTKKQASRFGIIECPDYPLYNTLDLWSYAASAVRGFLPEASRSVVADFADAVIATDDTQRHHLLSDAVFPRLKRGAAPHDLGEPREDPWAKVNAYVYQGSGRWKDLNSHFVLTAWADAKDADQAFAKRVFGAVEAAISHLRTFDQDNDGLIENDGIPDQTFDNIPMLGPSAYCGGLWLAALAAGAALAEKADEPQYASIWEDMLKRAQSSFDAKLWNGAHYKLDVGGQYRNALFSEQLYGPAMARRLGLGNVVPEANAVKALATIYRDAFLGAGKSEGVVAVTENGAPLKGLQRADVLVGCNFSFAMQCQTYGLEREAQSVLTALRKACVDERGVGFNLPAAYRVGEPGVRASMNLRTLAGFMLLQD